ncbi:hypothetical protein DL98DRAFT_541455 [Cadophora sp. DSE1049]|nr:hypothetical protein DL98DRAFT_541455 [Cadophora sp. DSE1049]
MSQGTTSFSWAKALRASPPLHFRQMSAIPDNESYHSEDLFSSSEESNMDWVSVGNQTPSLASMLGSSLVAFMKSHDFRQQTKAESPKASITPISGSLPITMSEPKALTSLSSVFGKKDDVASKKWSDLWDEVVQVEEQEKQLKTCKVQAARPWSHESKLEDRTSTMRPGESLEPNSPSFENPTKSNPEAGTVAANDINRGIVMDSVFSHEIPEP